ncbi:single-stranded DNA-binding protein [Spiribacter halobius]|uniref:Single-stranded DNA-binding protein n=1 Tax=Sediminicurvatus halobius TaxID=2182432 RepID=A0A2U2N074_9GAMM|nr:single-stranded DNA-binding protein [Spiribacter halobius]
MQRLLDVLPEPLHGRASALPTAELLELVLDLGRVPQARVGAQTIDLDSEPVSRELLDSVLARVGRFSDDNRAGIEGTLHRIAALRNRSGRVIGLTLRVGRAVYGTIDSLRDLIEDGRGVLLLGRPGVGKTTRLREMARVLADDCGRRVVVVDTSNEIGGDGDVPHPGIGSARRMQVPHPEAQHAVMIEAVENHMPEVIIVDEIGTAAEAAAARTIAERGVQLIATAHGTTLANLVANPTLADLVGGVQTVTLGDDEARARGTQKTVSERRSPPTFESVVEIVDRERLRVHGDTARAVDSLLRGRPPQGEPRGQPEPAAEGEAGQQAARPEPDPAPVGSGAVPPTGGRRLRLFAYAISADSLDRVIRQLRLPARVVDRAERADLVIALRGRNADPRLERLMAGRDIPVHVVKRNSTAQLRRLLQDLFNVVPGQREAVAEDAVREAEDGVRRARDEGVAVELTPRPAALRQLQHRIAMRHRLLAESAGSEPERRLVIQPPA